MKTNIRLFRIIVLVISLTACFAAAKAGPARPVARLIEQPDGSTFHAILRGDEFMKILTDDDGHAISKGDDGFFYYRIYHGDGTSETSGWKVGAKTPSGILARSMDIPYQALAAKAAEKRNLRNQLMDSGVLQRTLAGTAATKGGDGHAEKHGIVILAEFKDLKFTYSKADFVRLLTEPDSRFNGGLGSAMDYFNQQFKGLFNFTFQVSDIVTLPRNCSYYGKNDSNDQDVRPHEMIIDACRLAASSVDFSRYDDDGDGEVDNVFVIFAGGDEAEDTDKPDRIWSHAWFIKDGAGIDLEFNGKKINRYACTAELTRQNDGSYGMAGIGTFCHEFSHTLGLEDYYDTDYEGSGGTSDALWTRTALMDGGNHNGCGKVPPNYNAVDWDDLGIIEPLYLTEGRHELEPIQKNRKYYRLDTDNPDEYFLFECRKAEGWDKHIGGSGLLIYHIDKSENKSGFSASLGREAIAKERWEINEVNANPKHQCADLIEANPALSGSGMSDKIHSNSLLLSQLFFPYRSHDSFTSYSEPQMELWNGKKSSIGITGIKRSGDNIVFTVISSGTSVPEPVLESTEAYQDAAIISWSSGNGYMGECRVIWGENGKKTSDTLSVKAHAPGKYAVRLEGLKPLTPYVASIRFVQEGMGGKSVEAKFTTRSVPESGFPYMYLKYVERNQDGTYPAGTGFPLKLFNATDAEDIVWEMDGQEVSPDASGYFVPGHSGVLKAVILHEDGSRSIITRRIELK